MTGHAVWALAVAAVVATEYLLLRPSARQRLHRVLIAPVRWRAHCARRSLAALARAALMRPYRPIHAPTRRTHP